MQATQFQRKRSPQSAFDGAGRTPAQRGPRHTAWGYARQAHSPSPAGGDSFAYAGMAFLSRPPTAPLKMLTLVAILAGPIVLTTIVTVVVLEIKDAWDRNRLR